MQPAIMKLKRLICVGLVLGVGLFGCAKSSVDRLRPPSADQVRKWAGLSERTHLTMFTNVPADLWYGDDNLNLGKFKWLRAYEDRKGSNIDCFVIAVYESGAFWPSNRAKFINDLEHFHERTRINNKLPKTETKASESIERMMAPMTMPNGQKSYGFVIGFWPARFALGPRFDILAYQFVWPISYDEDHPPANPTEIPTNSFYEFFTNVDAFLTSQ